ncbi:MAG: fatty acid desaturase family protein [Planctomycetota bacterium]|nr:fatty acid desaturase family protein [Planctomycetota bacterium]
MEPLAPSSNPDSAIELATRPGTSARRIDRVGLADRVRSLSRINALRTWADIAFDWTIMLGAMAVTIRLDHWALYPFAIILIGSRQHALAILLHDASHYRLFKSRAWNDTVAEVCCGLPIGVSLKAFREIHLLHHWHVNEVRDVGHQAHLDDKDFIFPMKRKRMRGIIARDLLLLHVRQSFRGRRGYSPFGAGRGWRSWLLGRPRKDAHAFTTAERMRFLFTYGAVLTLALTLPWGIVWRAILLWMVAWCTVLTLCIRLRSAGEHLCVENQHELNIARHVDARWWERLGILPHGIQHHVAHHMFPSVPYYRLKMLHEGLLQDPVYAADLHRTVGVFGLLDELAPRVSETTRTPSQH